MGWYFNKGRGNLPLTLLNNSISMQGNAWLELVGSDETTPSVMRAVRRGQLHRQDATPAHLRPPRPPKVREPELPVSGDSSTPQVAKPAKSPKAAKSSKGKRGSAKPDVGNEVKTPTGDEVAASAAVEPKPFTAG